MIMESKLAIDLHNDTSALSAMTRVTQLEIPFDLLLEWFSFVRTWEYQKNISVHAENRAQTIGYLDLYFI